MDKDKTPKYGARQRQQEAKERRYKDAMDPGKNPRELTDKEAKKLFNKVIKKPEGKYMSRYDV